MQSERVVMKLTNSKITSAHKKYLSDFGLGNIETDVFQSELSKKANFFSSRELRWII